MSGHCLSISLRSFLAQTMKAFMGRLTWSGDLAECLGDEERISPAPLIELSVLCSLPAGDEANLTTETRRNDKTYFAVKVMV